MKPINHLNQVLVLIGVLLLGVLSCHNGEGISRNSSLKDSVLYQHTDSIIRTACRAENLERSLYVIDSLLDLHQISTMRADFGRAGAYMLHEDRETTIDYLRKVIDAYDKDGGDINLYSMAVVNLTSLLAEVKSQYEAALQLALSAIPKMEASPLVSKGDIGSVLVSIGWCQTGLELYDEANKSYEKAYQYFKMYQAEEACNLVDYRCA